MWYTPAADPRCRYCVFPLTLAALLVLVLHWFIHNSGKLSLQMIFHALFIDYEMQAGNSQLSVILCDAYISSYVVAYFLLAVFVVACGFLWSTKGK